MKILLLFLTCANQQEADTIATALLQKRLVACVKIIPITSKFIWEGAVDSGTEILLVMDTSENKFVQIEQEVKRLHSYEQFVLTATEVSQVSAGVANWIKTSCN